MYTTGRFAAEAPRAHLRIQTGPLDSGIGLRRGPRTASSPSTECPEAGFGGLLLAGALQALAGQPQGPCESQ